MGRPVELFRDLRFRDKLTFSTLMASLIPLLLFSLIVGTVVMRETDRRSRQLIGQMVTQTKESLDVYIETIEKLMDVVIDEGGDLSAEDADGTKAFKVLTSAILRAYPEIAGIAIAYPDDHYLGEGMTRISRDLFADESWYQYAVARDGQLGILGSALGRNVVNNLNESSDSIFSLVKSFRTADGYGVVLFDIRHDIIERSIERVSIGEEGFLYVADDTEWSIRLSAMWSIGSTRTVIWMRGQRTARSGSGAGTIWWWSGTVPIPSGGPSALSRRPSSQLDCTRSTRPLSYAWCSVSCWRFLYLWWYRLRSPSRSFGSAALWKRLRRGIFPCALTVFIKMRSVCWGPPSTIWWRRSTI